MLIHYRKTVDVNVFKKGFDLWPISAYAILERKIFEIAKSYLPTL